MKKIYKSLHFIGCKALKELLLTTSLGMTGFEWRDPCYRSILPAGFLPARQPWVLLLMTFPRDDGPRQLMQKCTCLGTEEKLVLGPKCQFHRVRIVRHWKWENDGTQADKWE